MVPREHKSGIPGHGLVPSWVAPLTAPDILVAGAGAAPGGGPSQVESRPFSSAYSKPRDTCHRAPLLLAPWNYTRPYFPFVSVTQVFSCEVSICTRCSVLSWCEILVRRPLRLNCLATVPPPPHSTRDALLLPLLLPLLLSSPILSPPSVVSPLPRPLTSAPSPPWPV